MVQVTSTFPALPADHPDAQRWLDAISAGRSEADAGLIRRAWALAERAHAGQTRASGEPYVTHARAVASILAELRLDAESIAAAILHDVAEDTATTLDDIRTQSGPGVAALVDGVTKLDVLPEVHRETAATRAGLLPELVLSVIEVESNFNPFAISSVGARGLMQVMPFWMKEIGRPGDSLFRVQTNLRYGCTILKYYLQRERGNLNLALRRYHGSLRDSSYPLRVNQALKQRWHPQ